MITFINNYCLFYTCNITLPRRWGSRPNSAHYISNLGYSAFEWNEGGWDVQNYGWITSIYPIYMLRGTPNDEVFSYKKINMWETLFGGDKLTVPHARGSIAVWRNHPDDKERLEGLVPTMEDWHSRMTFMKGSEM